MRRLKRAFAVTLQIAVVFGFEVAGCSSDNGPSAPGAGGSGGSGGATTGSGGSGGATTGSGGSGGATTGSGGSGGATTGSGGSGGTTTGSGGSAGTTTGSGGSAGSTTGSGGSSGTTTGSGGSAGAPKDGGGTAGTTTGSGGSAGTSDSGTGGAGGVADASSGKDSSGGDTGGGIFSPLCSAVPLTMAGEVPTKGGVCTPTDAQLCYKTCGPQSVGFKSETCTNGLYVEQSDCSFPDGDYACYKIPAAISATCPTATPKASQPCSVAECTLCNVAGNYLDSADATKPGYCVCPPGPDSGTARKWSCASTTAWPCPAGKGCL